MLKPSSAELVPAGVDHPRPIGGRIKFAIGGVTKAYISPVGPPSGPPDDLRAVVPDELARRAQMMRRLVGFEIAWQMFEVVLPRLEVRAPCDQVLTAALWTDRGIAVSRCPSEATTRPARGNRGFRAVIAAMVPLISPRRWVRNSDEKAVVASARSPPWHSNRGGCRS
jgi:hypothetical protein